MKVKVIPSALLLSSIDVKLATGRYLRKGGGENVDIGVNLFDGVSDFISDIISEDDAANADDGPDANNFDLECPSSCKDTALCKFDLTMLKGDTQTQNLEQMCDSGCIPNALVNGCASVDGVSDSAVSKLGAVVCGAVCGAGCGAGCAIGAAAAMKFCDFVSCCVINDEEGSVSVDASRFEYCQAVLPDDLDDLLHALAGAYLPLDLEIERDSGQQFGFSKVFGGGVNSGMTLTSVNVLSATISSVPALFYSGIL